VRAAASTPSSTRLSVMSTHERGDVWLASLDPRGTEPGKTRPVLIVQAQALLDAGHPSTLVVPLTTRLVDDTEPLRVRVKAAGRLRRESDLLVDQLRAIDNRRLIEGPLTRLPHATMRQVEDAIRAVLDFPE
jgi:mRNA interferase MazF